MTAVNDFWAIFQFHVKVSHTFPESFTNPNSNFVENARNVFRRSKADIAKGLVMQLIPFGAEFLGLIGARDFKAKETAFFINVVETTLEHRKKSKSNKRNDLVDLMVDVLKNNENILDEDEHADDQFEKDMQLKSEKIKPTNKVNHQGSGIK